MSHQKATTVPGAEVSLYEDVLDRILRKQVADIDTEHKQKLGTTWPYLSELSDLVFPFVASIFRSGKSSRISSLMSSSLGFFGRSILYPLLNVFKRFR